MSNLLASPAVFAGFSLAALAATVIVGVGLFLEYERHEDRAKRIGGLLVTGGVVLEALFGMVAFVSATVRESRSELQIAALTVSATQLEKETSGLRLQATNAEREAKEAESHLAEANARAKEADARAAEANEKAEVERLARVRIEQKLAPRSLTTGQQDKIAEDLKRFVGTPYTIRAYNEDEDAVALAAAIAAILDKATWTRKPTQHIMAFSLVAGVSIEVAPSHTSQLEPAAQALATDLNAEGIESHELLNSGVETEADMITIRVGHKPL